MRTIIEYAVAVIMLSTLAVLGSYFVGFVLRTLYHVCRIVFFERRAKTEYEPPTIKRVDPSTLSPELQAWVADVTRKKD